MASRKVRVDVRNPAPPKGGGKKPPTRKGAVAQARGLENAMPTGGIRGMKPPTAGDGRITALPYNPAKKPKTGATRRPAIRKKPPTSDGRMYAGGSPNFDESTGQYKTVRPRQVRPAKKKAGGVYGRGML